MRHLIFAEWYSRDIGNLKINLMAVDKVNKAAIMVGFPVTPEGGLNAQDER
ncbi:MAG: hypothetical protein ACXWF8_16890 [Methylobacter sp.]